MLFPTFQFVLIFLPIVLCIYALMKSKGYSRYTVGFLLLASMLFYLLPNWKYGYVITGSIVINYVLSKIIQSYKDRRSKLFLIIGIVFNLGLIGYFKYLFFFSTIAADLTGAEFSITKLILPVGISFYTFQQIAYLVDCFRYRDIHYNFFEYALFISFFPQLIAGPIVHHKQLMPQIHKLKSTPFDLEKWKIGIGFFIIGLAKKLVLADNLANLANPVFIQADNNAPVDTLAAWMGSIAYTLQLYFDFSAYSDMAIGLGLMFGISLPINFLSPYKSPSIVEFWRRWHITLSSFLRDYLYIALGGNRKGKIRRYTNLLITMLLGGLWHGAGWNFIIWGGLHGIYLVINHLFSSLSSGLNFAIPKLLSIAITFLGVVVAWVFFRAETTQGAWHILSAMMGLQTGNSLLWIPFDYLLVATGLAFVWFMPNTTQLFGYSEQTGRIKLPHHFQHLDLNDSRLFPLLLGILLALAFMFIPQPSVFIYFNF